MTPRAAVKPEIKIRAYDVVRRAVGDGIAFGLNRAHKHTPAPSRDALVEALELAIMSEICEVLQLEPDA